MGVFLSITLSIRLPRNVADRLEKEARKAGLGLEEYVLELVIQRLDPQERVREYIEVAKSLLEHAHEELKKGNVRQAAEKLWGAAALAVKAYADWREGKRLSSHSELWGYKRKIEKELGSWVHDSWANATEMHVCFYEGWCTSEDVKEATKRIEKLVVEIEKKVKS